MATPVFGGETIRRHGSDDLKQKLLPGIADGTIDFCMALTEPDAGQRHLRDRDDRDAGTATAPTS